MGTLLEWLVLLPVDPEDEEEEEEEAIRVWVSALSTK